MHKCRPATSSFVPRLLFVGDVDSPTRLIETMEGAGKPLVKHAALSYSWGAEKGAFITTLQNIEANKRGVTLDKLPKASPLFG